jgi:hypothetical protein
MSDKVDNRTQAEKDAQKKKNLEMLGNLFKWIGDNVQDAEVTIKKTNEPNEPHKGIIAIYDRPVEELDKHSQEWVKARGDFETVHHTELPNGLHFYYEGDWSVDELMDHVEKHRTQKMVVEELYQDGDDIICRTWFPMKWNTPEEYMVCTDADILTNGRGIWGREVTYKGRRWMIEEGPPRPPEEENVRRYERLIPIS